MKSVFKDHIEKLELFVAVAKAGSFRAAAVRLRHSQPSLSHSIQLLEGSLGKPLFHRTRKGVHLTSAGEELLKFSERLISEVDSVEQRIRNPENALAGTLNVGTFTSFISYLWPPFLREMARKQKMVHLQLSTLKGSEVSAALNSRKFHFVVSTERIPLQDAINIELYRDSFGLFFSRKYLAHLKKNPKEAENEPLLYVPDARDLDGRSLEQLLWQSGIRNQRSIQLDNFDAVRALAAEGLGIAVLPLRVAKAGADSLERISRGAYGEAFGEHIVFCSLLASDRNDPRVSLVVESLKSWCQGAK